MKTNLMFYLLLLFIPFVGCDKLDNELPIAFKYRALDVDGNERSVFNEGENVIFSFVTENKSDRKIFTNPCYPNYPGFFDLYKINTSEGDFNLGSPFEFYILVNYKVEIDVNGATEIQAPWYKYASGEYPLSYPYDGVHVDTPDLTKGEYKSSFSASFKFKDADGNEYETETKYFEFKFTVK